MAAPYTTSTALLEALVSAGVTHLFVNLGSDHPAIIEAISAREISGTTNLKFITAPNEFVGLCAAQGFFQASGIMQAILVHVDAGTYAMGGAIHNVSRARIPVIMIAGTSPITDEGELIGGRNVSYLWRVVICTRDDVDVDRNLSIICKILLIREVLSEVTRFMTMRSGVEGTRSRSFFELLRFQRVNHKDLHI
jgi:hypothetical protein